MYCTPEYSMCLDGYVPSSFQNVVSLNLNMMSTYNYMCKLKRGECILNMYLMLIFSTQITCRNEFKKFLQKKHKSEHDVLVATVRIYIG